MRLDSRVYRYIEYELYHYEQYKRDIKRERERILEGSPPPPDGMPKGGKEGKPTEEKAVRLSSSASIAAMERVVEAVDMALRILPETGAALFRLWYVKGRKDRYAVCDQLHISEATFTRYKRQLIETVAKELGMTKN